MFNRPERTTIFPEIHTLEETVDGEENCNGSIARSYLFACGLVCAGYCSRGAPATDRGASPAAAGSQLCLDRRLSPLGWRSLCVGRRPLGSSTSSGSALGCSPLGSPRRPLGDGGRTLALDLGWKKKRAG